MQIIISETNPKYKLNIYVTEYHPYFVFFLKKLFDLYHKLVMKLFTTCSTTLWVVLVNSLVFLYILDISAPTLTREYE